MAQLIKVDGSLEEIRPASGESFTLKELQALVGGFIETMGLPGGKTMIFDEEGKLNDRPRNGRATTMVAARLQEDDCIVGDVVICDETEFN